MMLRGFWRMNHARDCREFRESLRDWTAPVQNIVYADIDGNREFTAAQPEQAFYGVADANDFATDKQVRDAQMIAALSLSAAGTPVWAMPNGIFIRPVFCTLR